MQERLWPPNAGVLLRAVVSTSGNQRVVVVLTKRTT